jgi:hypothetical protein
MKPTRSTLLNNMMISTGRKHLKLLFDPSLLSVIGCIGLLSVGLLSGLPLHSQTSQASSSTSVRANQKAAAVNQRTTNSSLLLERVDEDLFQIGKHFVTGLGPQTKTLDVPFIHIVNIV